MKDSEVDVVGVMQRYIGNLHDKRARTHGGEWAGKCPLPGCTSREDSFLAWPYREEGDGPLWWCRQCRQSGRLKKFLRLVDPQNYHVVCEDLGLSPDDGYEPRLKAAPPALAQGVNLLWVSRACEFALECKARLWDGSLGSTNALKWLRARGFTDAMIDASGFGFHPADRKESFVEWGLSPEKDRSGIWLPAGIVIPWRAGGEIVKLEIRRADATIKREMATTGRKTKYVTVQGSSEMYLYGIDTIIPGAPVLLCEGVFDARAFRQAVGFDQPVGVVATGSAGKGRPAPGRTNDSVEALKRASIVLLALDPDAAGDTGADGWLAYLSNAHIWQPLIGDINAMLLAGDDISLWFETGLAHYADSIDAARRSLAVETNESAVNDTAAEKDGQRPPRGVLACHTCGRNGMLHIHAADGKDARWCLSCALHECFRGNNVAGEVYIPPVYDFSGVPGYQQEMYEQAVLMAAWMAPERHNLLMYTLCFACEQSATHFDLHGRLWCAQHAPRSAGKMAEHTLPYEQEELEACDDERCFVCGKADIDMVDVHTRAYCAACAPSAFPMNVQQLHAIARALAHVINDRCRVSYCDTPAIEHGWCAAHRTRETLLEMCETLGWRSFSYGDGLVLPAGKDAISAFVREMNLETFAAVYAAAYRIIHRIPAPTQKVAASEKQSGATKVAPIGPRCSYVACNRAAVFIDEHGVGWCDSPGCSLRYGFLMAAERLGYPQVQYGTRPGAVPKPLILQANREAYLEFARKENWMPIEKMLKGWETVEAGE